jgi:hypothetical protein
MKLASIILLLTIGSVFAQENVEVPILLKDSTIATTLKNGRAFKFDGNKYMVVLRKPRKVNPVEAPKVVERITTVVVRESFAKLNRFKIVAGYGPDGFKSRQSNNTVDIASKNDLLGGLGYDRMLGKELSVGGQVLSNGTTTLGVGYDF